MKTLFNSAAAIRDAQDYIEYSKKRAAVVHKNKKAINATADLLNRRLAGIGDGSASLFVWPDIDAYGGTVKIQVSITVTTDSMLEGVVPQILKAMLDMECEATASKDIATAEDARRQYTFKRAATDHFLAFTISVDVNIKETDTGTCKKIQTGTKMVEVAEYKLECTGE